MKNHLITRFMELKGLSKRIRTLNILITSTIILFAVAIIMQFLAISVFYAILPVFVYLLLSVRDMARCHITLNKISEKYPEIEEQLKTAYDNKDREDIIVKSLLLDVSRGMDNMRYSSFFETGRTTIRILFAIFLAFLLLSVNLINFADANSTLYRNWNFLGNIGNLDLTSGGKDSGSGGDQWEAGNYTAPKEREKVGSEAGGQRPGVSQGPEPGRGGGVGEELNKEIYGAPSSAKIEGKDIMMEMHPEFGGEIEIRDTNQEKTDNEFLISSVESTKTPEQEPVEYQEIIKRYFEMLLEEDAKK